jgi:hypothetical protein
MPRESTLGGRDDTTIVLDQRQSKEIARYAQFAWHNVSAK